MKQASKICLLSFIVVIVSGCNTVNGIGKDVSKGGQAIERAAQ